MLSVLHLLLIMQSKAFHGCIKSVSRVARLLGTVALALTFTFWGHQAIVKFISKPISTKVYFRNGDDGLGNIQFPAVSVCLSDYAHFQRRFQAELLDHRCHAGLAGINSFRTVTALCYGKDVMTSTTTEGEGFGDLFGEPETTVVPFDDMHQLIEETSLNKSDMIFWYKLGREHELHWSEHKEDFIEEDWHTSIDETYGKCFTFDPKRLNISMIETFIPFTMDPQFFDLELTFMKLLEKTTHPVYRVFIHEDTFDLLDAPYNFPFFKIGPKETLLVKISKTNISSLPSDDFICSHQVHYGQQRCINQEVRFLIASLETS